jgi:hypothetical protein
MEVINKLINEYNEMSNKSFEYSAKVMNDELYEILKVLRSNLKSSMMIQYGLLNEHDIRNNHYYEFTSGIIMKRLNNKDNTSREVSHNVFVALRTFAEYDGINADEFGQWKFRGHWDTLDEIFKDYWFD